MPYLTDLATACRKSGLPVVEVPGWQTRGHGPMTSVRSVVNHHTATSSRAVGDYPTLRIVRDGRPGLAGPLSQLGLGRSGTVYVIAAGLSYHAGVVVDDDAWNDRAIGIEAEHDGISPFPGRMYDALVRLNAALVTHYDWEDKPGPEDDAEIWGHKEVNRVDGKIDPVFDMNRFRADVHACAYGAGYKGATLAPTGTLEVKPTGAVMTPAQEAKLDAILLELNDRNSKGLQADIQKMANANAAKLDELLRYARPAGPAPEAAK